MAVIQLVFICAGTSTKCLPHCLVHFLKIWRHILHSIHGTMKDEEAAAPLLQEVREEVADGSRQAYLPGSLPGF
jgi:hypothetical protein